MRVSYNNILNNATLSATNENINKPITNIIHNYLHLDFQADSYDTEITAILDDLYSIDHIALGYHNLDSIIVSFYDASNVLISTEILDLTFENNIYYFDEKQNIKKIIFDCDTLDTDIYIGKISTGLYTEFPRFTQGMSGGLILNTYKIRSNGGQVTGTRNKDRKSYGVSFSKITNDQLDDFIDYASEVQNIISHFVDLFPDAHDYMYPLHVVIESDNIPREKRRIQGFNWNIQINYEEAF